MIERIIEFSARHRLFVLAPTLLAAVAGWYSMISLPLDVLPEAADRQVIIHSRWERSPDLIDAQVTYPIVTALLAAPGVKSVRGISDFGASFVYVTFDDDTDLYWARSRTLEYLSAVLGRLPEGVTTELGPDATSLGWVFQYVLLDRSGSRSLAQLRSYQDWYLSYYLRGVPGVSEVATVGGFVLEYQVNVDPNRLRAYGISIQRVVEAVKAGNGDMTGRVVESGGAEFVIRGLGNAASVADLEEVLVASAPDRTPIRVKDVANVTTGSGFRRGLTDLDGTGEVVSGIIVMRQGQNVLNVIDRVKARIHELGPSMPVGLEILPIYDRSELIHRSIDNLQWTIFEVVLTVAAITLAFLWHFPSAIVPLITIPLAVLIAFIPLRLLGISANLMSLAGIAMAIGALVDAGIVVAEQTHKRLEEWDREGRCEGPEVVIIRAIQQVGRTSFFALLVIAVSFLPVLTLESEEGALFRSLAYAKSLAILIAALLAITLTPALRLLLARIPHFRFRPSWLCRIANSVLVGEVYPEEKHPFSRRLIRYYEPVVTWSLHHRITILCATLLLMGATVPLWWKLGTEFMPPLEEGTLLYMPTTTPSISIVEAERLVHVTDRILRQFPEVDHVLGKAGRAETATDPAPLSMLETIVTLRPESTWRRVPTWYSSWAPEWVRPVLRRITPDHLSRADLVARMDEALKLPGVANSWSMPIRGRMDMLATGIRTPLGIKIAGNNPEEIEQIGEQIGRLLASVKGTRGVFAERTAQGSFADFRWNRIALGSHGLTIDQVQKAVQYAIGGETATFLLHGRERYPVSVRYMPDFRSDMEALKRLLVPAGGQEQVPISELAEIRTNSGPAMIRNEDGMLTGYVYVDVSGRDLAGYVDEADQLIRTKLSLPRAYSIVWSGQYQSIIRMEHRLWQIIPLTLVLVLLLLYWNTRSAVKTLMVLLAVPFSAVGAIWLLYLLGYHLSAAVWVGLIALMGIDAETGVLMLLYLDQAIQEARLGGRLTHPSGLVKAVLAGAARRIRPKFMTVATMFLGLMPLMWSSGAGSDIMKRIAAPMVGGIFTSFALELIVYPVLYHAWRSRTYNLELAQLPKRPPVLWIEVDPPKE